MGSDNERLQQYSRYPKDPSQRSSRSGERKSERKRSPSPRSQKRSSRPPPRSRSREKPSGRSGRGHSPDYQYPPSNLARGDPVPSTRPRTYSMAGMTDAEIRAQWKRENEEMRAEDALNRSRHNEAEYNKRAQEARSRSRRRSDRAFSKPQHSSGEGGYSGDGRGYYTQEGRDLAPPPFSGSGYDSRHSRRESEAPSSDHDPYNQVLSSDRHGQRHTGQSRDDRRDERPRQRSRTRSPSLARMFKSFKEYTRRS